MCARNQPRAHLASPQSLLAYRCCPPTHSSLLFLAAPLTVAASLLHIWQRHHSCISALQPFFTPTPRSLVCFFCPILLQQHLSAISAPKCFLVPSSALKFCSNTGDFCTYIQYFLAPPPRCAPGACPPPPPLLDPRIYFISSLFWSSVPPLLSVACPSTVSFSLSSVDVSLFRLSVLCSIHSCMNRCTPTLTLPYHSTALLALASHFFLMVTMLNAVSFFLGSRFSESTCPLQ